MTAGKLPGLKEKYAVWERIRGIFRGGCRKDRRGMRLVPALLAAVLLLTGLGGCRKEESAPVPPGSGPRFEGTALPAPEDMLSIQPVFWDEETGEFYCLAFAMDAVPLPEGGFGRAMRWEILTAAPGGEGILREEVLPLDPLASVFEAVIGRDEAFFLLTRVRDAGQGDEPRDVFLGRYDRGTGEAAVSESITAYFPTEGYWNEAFCAGPDGTLYVGAGREVLLFAPDFRYLGSVPVPGDVSALGLDGDGETVVVCADLFLNQKLYRAVCSLDAEKRETTERFRVESWDGCGSPLFAPGRDLYLMDRAGIWGVVSKENGGTGEPEMVMDFTASDVIRENASLGGIIDADRIVMVERSMDGEQNWIPSPVLYTRAEETDLSGVTVLTLAYDISDPRLTSKIVAFNKANRDIRVTPVDYVREGEGRLALDMAAGLVRPDIVVTSPDGDCARMLYEKKLCTDLTPYLEGDKTPGGLNGENLFGAVKHAFDDGEGGLWGLSTGFSLVTLAARRDTLPPDAAERGCWTLSEMTDFAASLPDGVDFLRIPCREYFAAVLEASEGFAEFIDRKEGVCSFDSPEFRRVLDYMLSLPGIEELTAAGFTDDGTDYLPYLEGKVALRDVTLQSPGEVMGLGTLFNTEDYVLIGLPTPVRRDGAGIRTDMKDAVVITSFSTHPEAAWEAVGSLIGGEIPTTVSMGGALHDPIPPLRSQLERMIEGYRAGDMEFRFFFEGGAVMKHGDREHPTDPGTLDKPGIVSFFTEEAEAELLSILDRAGTPLMGTADGEVQGIVGEELSALFAGSCTPEECARRIQSRVGIRLAEIKK